MMDECKWGVARVTGRPGAAMASRGRTGNRWWPCLYIWRLYLGRTVYHLTVWPACPVWTAILRHSGPLWHPKGGACSGHTIIPSHWAKAEFPRLGRLLDWQHQMNLLHQCLTLEDTRRCNSLFLLSAVTAHEYIMDTLLVNTSINCVSLFYCVSFAPPTQQ